MAANELVDAAMAALGELYSLASAGERDRIRAVLYRHLTPVVEKRLTPAKKASTNDRIGYHQGADLTYRISGSLEATLRGRGDPFNQYTARFQTVEPGTYEGYGELRKALIAAFVPIPAASAPTEAAIVAVADRLLPRAAKSAGGAGGTPT